MSISLPKPRVCYYIFGQFQQADFLEMQPRALAAECELPTGIDITFLSGEEWEEDRAFALDTVIDYGEENYPQLFQQLRTATAGIRIVGLIEQGDRDIVSCFDALSLMITLLMGGVQGDVLFDMFTLSLLSGQDWFDIASTFEVNPCPHVKILVSEELGQPGFWLHTKGMIKYGRPDLSMRQVAESDISGRVTLLNRLIREQILDAAVYQDHQIIDMVHNDNQPHSRVRVVYAGSMEDSDFNNIHLDVSLIT